MRPSSGRRFGDPSARSSSSSTSSPLPLLELFILIAVASSWDVAMQPWLGVAPYGWDPSHLSTVWLVMGVSTFLATPRHAPAHLAAALCRTGLGEDRDGRAVQGRNAGGARPGAGTGVAVEESLLRRLF